MASVATAAAKSTRSCCRGRGRTLGSRARPCGGGARRPPGALPRDERVAEASAGGRPRTLPRRSSGAGRGCRSDAADRPAVEVARAAGAAAPSVPGAPCEPSTCAHDLTQRACAVVIELGRGERLGAGGEPARRGGGGARRRARLRVRRGGGGGGLRSGGSCGGLGARARRRRSCVHKSTLGRSTQESSRADPPASRPDGRAERRNDNVHVRLLDLAEELVVSQTVVLIVVS